MNNYKEEFNIKKNNLIEIINSTEEFYKKYNKKEEVEVFEQILKNVNENEFSIVLVGEFSAGKSTFLNALMGERILPSFTNETTATINYLRHKDKAENGEAGKVYFKDGRVEVLEKLDFDKIAEYVSTKSSIGVVNEVDHLDLFIESKFLEGNITLVDSPGLNGVADFHREVTEKQIKKSSASIFMFRADQPGSKSDFNFLTDLRKKVNTIIFALNKIDAIKATEGQTVESVIDNVKRDYKKEFPDDTVMPEIWGISAYAALVARSKEDLDYRGRLHHSEEEKEKYEKLSRMKEFEDRLWRFITQGEKAKAMLSSPIDKVVNSLANDKALINEERKVLEGEIDSDDIKNEIEEINNQIDALNENINSKRNSIENELDLLIDEVKEELEVNLENIKEKNIKKLDTWRELEELQQFKNNLVKNVEKQYKKEAERIEKSFTKGTKQIISNNYSEITNKVNNRINSNSFNLNIDTKYENTETIYEIGIEKYEKEIKDLERRLREKQNEVEKAEDNYFEAKKKQREKEELEAKLRNREEAYYRYENMQLVDRRYAEEKISRKKERGGIIGGIIDVLIGEKEIEEIERYVINEDEVQESKDLKEEKQRRILEEQEKLKIELEKIKGLDIDQEESLKNRYIRQEAEIRAEIERKQREFKENYMKKNKAVLREEKYALEDYFDSINDEYKERLEEELENNKDKFVEIIEVSITSALNEKLEKKKNKLINLENRLKASVAEKNKRLEELDAREEELNNIISRAIALKVDIDSEVIDVIREEI